MRRTMLKSKIHRAIVTDASVDYEGSITIDRALMDAADLLEYEQVHIWDVTNGARLVTYVIEGIPGSGTISINGAAALLINRGDKIIIGSYGDYDESEVRNLQPRKIFVDEGNRPVKK